jgi:perosamine synthetase
VSAHASAEDLRRAVSAHFGAAAVALTDSGTSALVVALRALLPVGGTVALPAYACVDLISAAAGARARVRLYDADPATLGPDLESLRRALERGADAVVVAHLYGYPVDVAAVRSVADAFGTHVIEDAAQQAGGRLRSVALGSTGPLTVLSFGRGKGTTGGRGGALLAATGAPGDLVATVERAAEALRTQTPAGWGDVGRAAAQYLFGRPSLYGIPASIPALQLGETVYHVPHEPRALSRGAAAMVRQALGRLASDRAARATRAAWYTAHLGAMPTIQLVRPIDGAEPGYLRFPVLISELDASRRDGAPSVGVVRSYPRPLGEEPNAQAVLHPGEPATPGAREICDRLFTLPTYSAVADRDAERIVAWAGRKATEN